MLLPNTHPQNHPPKKTTASLLRRMDFQPRLGVITRSLRRALPDLLHFALVAGAVFLGYAVTGFLLLGDSIPQFAGLGPAVNTCFAMMLGEFGEVWAAMGQLDGVQARGGLLGGGVGVGFRGRWGVGEGQYGGGLGQLPRAGARRAEQRRRRAAFEFAERYRRGRDSPALSPPFPSNAKRPPNCQSQGVAAALFFWTFMLLVFLVLLNFLLAIIVDAFAEVRRAPGCCRCCCCCCLLPLLRLLLLLLATAAAAAGLGRANHPCTSGWHSTDALRTRRRAAAPGALRPVHRRLTDRRRANGY
jgi:hypothetical protein